MRELDILTFSNYSTWNRCRKDWEWRNVVGVVKKEISPALRFGTLIHEGLHALRKGRQLGEIWKILETKTAQLGGDTTELLKAKAMLCGYQRTYGDETAKVLHNEERFETDIWNPETGYPSKTFRRAGKIDCITKEEDGLWVRETKTTTTLGEGYLLKLWLDAQIAFYVLAAQINYGYEIKGCIYDVLVKSSLKQGKGETEQEYEERAAELRAKSKNGTTTAKRKLPESDEDFEARLTEQYAEQKMFHREKIYVGQDALKLLESELWNACKEIREAKAANFFRRNTDACFKWNRPCQYHPLCSSSGNTDALIQNMYEYKEPNAELLDTENEET